MPSNLTPIVALKPCLYDFVEVLGSNLNSSDQLIILDIFASAREQADNDISSQQLVKAIQDKFSQAKVLFLADIHQLADYLKNNRFDLNITIGAGDIYKVYELLSFTQ